VQIEFAYAAKHTRKHSIIMTTLATTQIEFRCQRCWQSNCADSDLAGSSVSCRVCGNPVEVPEATEDRIVRAQELLASQFEQLKTLQEVPSDRDRALSDREIEAIARKESYVPLEKRDFSGYPTASIPARLIASLVDNVLLVTTFLGGFAFSLYLAKQGLVPNPLHAIQSGRSLSLSTYAAFCAFTAVLVPIQWLLLSTRGQTLGKMIMMIRIVSQSGQLPGFFQAVFLRNWVRHLLSFIPFFAIVDLIFGLGGSRRCLHDYLAGTRVVSNL
jgi:uncharacterized RDD family membrane protein YckC